jgi:hypothetical protein
MMLKHNIPNLYVEFKFGEFRPNVTTALHIQTELDQFSQKRALQG